VEDFLQAVVEEELFQICLIPDQEELVVQAVEVLEVVLQEHLIQELQQQLEPLILVVAAEGVVMIQHLVQLKVELQVEVV
jgi:hypothetical protein